MRSNNEGDKAPASYTSSEEFLRRLDAGELDECFYEELGKLTTDQLKQVGKVLSERCGLDPPPKSG